MWAPIEFTSLTKLYRKKEIKKSLCVHDGRNDYNDIRLTVLASFNSIWILNDTEMAPLPP